MRKLVAFACLAAAALSACTPDTKYRYSAFVPSARALSWDGRTAKDGSLRLEGAISGVTVNRNMTPTRDDTGLRVPNTTLEGVGTLAIAPGLELGGRYSYAAYAWGDMSAQGTMPLPSHPSVWGVGPEARGTIPFDRQKRFALGISGNFMRYQIGYAEWQRDPGCTPGPTCVIDYSTAANTRYRLNTERSESHWTMNVGVYPSVQISPDGELGHLFFGLAAHTGFKNKGFTDENHNGSTLEDAGLVWIVGAGYGIKLEPLRLSTMFTLPLTNSQSPVNYGVSGFFTVGLDLELWESDEDRRRRIQEQERSAAPAPPR
jgi:hypothetical protein